MTETPCPFCQVSSNRIFHHGKQVLGLWDAFPVSPGHALLVTRRHVSDWFLATPEERAELTEAISVARTVIEARHQPAGFNIGINCGPSAGQTIPHLHVHVIPRYAGDIDDPRGGVRNVIPSLGNYLSKTPPAPLQFHDGNPGQLLVRGGADPLRPHLIDRLDQAVRADIAVAFILESGVRALRVQLVDLLERGGRLRLLAGDYLGVTDPNALLQLIDLEGNAELRIFESSGRSFHPKAYIFYDGKGSGTAFVGSSNMTETALGNGVEWNYRVISSRDERGFGHVAEAFEELFAGPATSPLTPEWIESYRSRRKVVPIHPVEVAQEAPLPPPEPHGVQLEALEALQATRDEGNSAGLVVLATGLGKTWLSAFDSHRPEYRRILFVAHREEILAQARSTFRRIRPEARLGHYMGQNREPDADVLFASIQTLGRANQLRAFAPADFDYIVVDEFHHASAPTYRRLIEYFRPKFLLGLTATPERTDGGDLLALCGENLVYRVDFAEGIEKELLSPFRYFGVPDEVDYSNIPWRSSRFDEEALTNAVATQSRAKNALDQYRLRAGKRTLAFCCSQRHADFMAAFFREAGLRAVAVHSGPATAPRATSLEMLADGKLDIVFAVDMFNEE